MEKYINYEMCKQCGGQCCKENGCIYLPKDFKDLSFEGLKKEIDKGYISISGQPFNGFLGNAWSYLLCLRARNVNSKIVDLFTSGGPCMLLTDTGCKLNESKRPSLGLLVEPTKIGGPCDKKYDSELCLWWLNYSDVLSKLVKYYTNKEVKDVIIEQITEKIAEINKKLDNSIELTEMEKVNIYWYREILCGKPYYSQKEVQKIRRKMNV